MNFSVIAEKLNSGLARVSDITAGLGHQKWCARLVRSVHTPKMKRVRLESCQQLLTHYQIENTDFLNSSVTGDESWVCHYKLQLKSQ